MTSKKRGAVLRSSLPNLADAVANVNNAFQPSDIVRCPCSDSNLGMKTLHPMLLRDPVVSGRRRLVKILNEE